MNFCIASSATGPVAAAPVAAASLLSQMNGFRTSVSTTTEVWHSPKQTGLQQITPNMSQNLSIDLNQVCQSILTQVGPVISSTLRIWMGQMMFQKHLQKLLNSLRIISSNCNLSSLYVLEKRVKQIKGFWKIFPLNSTPVFDDLSFSGNCRKSK